MYFLILIVYAIFSVLLAIPYCWLAGWSYKGYGSVVILGPAIILIWLVAATFVGLIDVVNYKFHVNWCAIFNIPKNYFSEGMFWGFWVLTVMILLPITAHWMSMLVVLLVGDNQFSQFLEVNRYALPGYLLLILIAIVIMIFMIDDVKYRIKKVWGKFFN